MCLTQTHLRPQPSSKSAGLRLSQASWTGTLLFGKGNRQRPLTIPRKLNKQTRETEGKHMQVLYMEHLFWVSFTNMQCELIFCTMSMVIGKKTQNRQRSVQVAHAQQACQGWIALKKYAPTTIIIPQYNEVSMQSILGTDADRRKIDLSLVSPLHQNT